jgi:hypothetical protein
LSADVIGRRRAVEERLARARTLAQSLDGASAELVEVSGLPIENLDPDSSLRTALSALAEVAAFRPGFDIIVALPGASYALRVQHDVDQGVEIEVLQRDSPDEAADPAEPVAAEIPVTPDPAAPEPAPEPAGGHVASDLAAMLWQNVGDSPS